MLGFKFIDTLQEHGLKGPVPVLGIFGGDKHIPDINYQNIFNSSTIVAILSTDETYGSVTQHDLINLSNTPLVNKNKLQNSELIDPDGNLTETGNDPPAGWTFSGQGSGGTEDIKIEEGIGDDYSESPYTTYPSKKISVIGTTANKRLNQTFPAVTGDIVTASIYISYGNVGSNPIGNGEPRSTFKLDDATDTNNGSNATVYILYNADGTILLQRSGGLDCGYDTLQVGTKTWYRVWITTQLTTAVSGSEGKLYFWPAGWVDQAQHAVPAGYVYIAHPQVESHTIGTADYANIRYATRYSPTYNDSNFDFYKIPNIIAGQPSTNMVAPLGHTQIIYDASTNKPFTDYTKGKNKIFFSADDYKNKHLVYRDNDFTGSKIRMLHPNDRFHTTWDGSNQLYINEAVTPSINLMQDPADKFDISVPIRNNRHPWNINIKTTFELYSKNIIKITGGSNRYSKVWDESPTKISSKLFQLSEKGLTRWKYDKTWIDASPYFLIDTGDIDLLLNYEDYNVVDVDINKGLILFENDPPHDLTVSYSLDNSWFVLPVELNPLLSNNIPETIEIKVSPNGRIVYELDGSGVLIDNGSEMFSLAAVYHQYKTIAIVTMKWGKPEIIDIRREGGMLLDIEKENLDIDSHVTYGFMGINPTQLNMTMIKIPDKALENLIYQWEETHFLYDPEDPFSYPLDWNNNRDEYINWLSSPPSSEADGYNHALTDLITFIKRCIPAGIPVSIFDKQDNYIGRSS